MKSINSLKVRESSPSPHSTSFLKLDGGNGKTIRGMDAELSLQGSIHGVFSHCHHPALKPHRRQSQKQKLSHRRKHNTTSL